MNSLGSSDIALKQLSSVVDILSIRMTVPTGSL